MSDQYDNTNKGAAWPTKAVKGKMDIQGQLFYMDIVQTGREAPAPIYNLYLVSAKSRLVYGTGLFLPKKADSKAKASGLINLHSEGGEYWLNLFANKPEGNQPVVRILAQAKEPEAGSMGPSDPKLPQAPPATEPRTPYDNPPPGDDPRDFVDGDPDSNIPF